MKGSRARVPPDRAPRDARAAAGGRPRGEGRPDERDGREEPGKPRRARHPRGRAGPERRALDGTPAARAHRRAHHDHRRGREPRLRLLLQPRPPPRPDAAEAGRDHAARRWRRPAARSPPASASGPSSWSMGFLEPKELVRGVVDQTRAIILHAFEWTWGTYELQEGASPAEAITLDISTPELILEGVSRIEAWSRIERGAGGSGRATCRSRGARGCSSSSRSTWTRGRSCARSRPRATWSRSARSPC